MGRGRTKELLSAGPGGVREDVNPGIVPDGQWLSSNNWLVRNQEGQPRPGYETFASVISSADRITGIGFRGSAYDADNIVFHSLANAGHWTGSSLASITGTWTTSNNDELVRMTTMESGGTTYLLRVNAQNSVGRWSGSGNFAVASNAPTGRDILILGRRAVVLAAENDGLRVDWSGYTDIDAWSSTIQTTSLDDTPGDIIAGRPISPLSAGVFKEDSTWLMSTQIAIEPFQFQLLSNGPGPVSSAALVTTLGAVYFLALDLNVYRFDGVSVSEPIARGLANTLKNNFSFDNRALVHGFALNETSPEIWFFYPMSGSTDLTSAISVNVLDGTFTPHEFTDNITASAGYIRKAGQTVDDLTGSIDDLSGTIDSLEVAGGVTALFGGGAGQPYQFGVALDDNGTSIAWDFYHGYRSPGGLGTTFYLDGVTSYWKTPAASTTVTVHVKQTDALDGAEAETTDTIELTQSNNHLVTFPNREPMQWIQVGFSGSENLASLRHRGAAILGWKKAFK